MKDENGVSRSERAPNIRNLSRHRLRAKPAAALRTRHSKPKIEATTDQLQRWVQEVVTHIGGVGGGIASPGAQALIPIESADLGRVILPSKNLTSHERIGIYADMYYLRIADCLGRDFEAVAYAVGAERFEQLAREFINAHPSEHYSLNKYGAAFPTFLKNEVGDLEHRDFLVELASLEWLIQEIFEVDEVKPVTVAKLQAVPNDKLGDAKLKFMPGVRLRRFDYPVNVFLQSFYDEKNPSIPVKRANYLRLFRTGYRVWRARVDKHQFNLLTAISQGASMGDALQMCLDNANPKEQIRIAESVGEWFKEWAADGMFAAISVKK